MQIGVLILAGFDAEAMPSTSTVHSARFPTIESCEANLIKMRLLGTSTAGRTKTSGVFVEGDYKQVVVSSPVNLEGYGKGVIYYSCIPVSEQ